MHMHIFSVIGDFLDSKGSPIQNSFNFTAAGVRCRVVALKVFPYFIIHGADYISGPFGSFASFPTTQIS